MMINKIETAHGDDSLQVEIISSKSLFDIFLYLFLFVKQYKVINSPKVREGGKIAQFEPLFFVPISIVLKNAKKIKCFLGKM